MIEQSGPTSAAVIGYLREYYGQKALNRKPLKPQWLRSYTSLLFLMWTGVYLLFVSRRWIHNSYEKPLYRCLDGGFRFYGSTDATV